MTNHQLYAGIIRAGEGYFTVHFHDLKFDAKPVYSPDFNVVINDSLNQLTEKLTEAYLKKEVWPDATAIYKIHKHIGEVGRVLLSFALDDKSGEAKCSGYLLANTDSDSDELLWDEINSFYSRMEATADVSDEFRQFRKFRELMNITDGMKDKLHSKMKTLIAGEKEDEEHGLFDKISQSLACSRNNLTKTFKENWDISIEVYNRLLLRYAILRDMEKLERRYAVHESLSKENEQKLAHEHRNQERQPAYQFNQLHLVTNEVTDDPLEKNQTMPEKNKDEANQEEQKPEIEKQEKPTPDVRAYRLATTDVFVEKAIAYLERDANIYTKYGLWAFGTAGLLLVIGVIFSAYVYWPFSVSNVNQSPAEIKPTYSINSSCKRQQVAINASLPGSVTLKVECPPNIASKSSSITEINQDSWKGDIVRFTQGFTFYGMLVLTVVGLWRIGKAMLDQAERLKDRRHALRQGRLFVHLNDGTLKPDDLEKAFAWNTSNRNAFENIQTEATAPWGGVFKEGFKAIAEALKSKKD